LSTLHTNIYYHKRGNKVKRVLNLIKQLGQTESTYITDPADDSPPEPAPPEIPPRGGSLHSATLRRMTEYQLPNNGDVISSEETQYLPAGNCKFLMILN